MRLFSNNAASLLDADISDSATALDVSSLEGALFPSPSSPEYFMLTLEDGSGNIEIVKCTARVDDTLTVARAQEGTAALAFTAGDRVELRLTAETLAAHEPGSAVSGAGSVALGYEITGTGAESTVFGNLIATAAYPEVTIVGYNVTVGGGSATGVGHGVSVGLRGVAVGSGAAATSDCVAVGRNSSAAGVGSFAAGYESVAGNSSVAVGGNTDASGVNSTAVGVDSKATHLQALALGKSAEALAVRCTAIATQASIEGGLVFQGFPTTPRENFWFYDGDGAPYAASAVATVSSPPVDLGPGVEWQSSTAYRDQDVVVPTTPNNKQYYLWHGDYDGSTDAVNTATSGPSEPTWPTATQGDWAAAEATETHYWIMADPLTGVSMNVSNAYGMIGSTPRVKFYPTRVGFICFNYSTLSAAPYISIGNGSSPTAYVNNQQLTGITQSGQMQYFDVTNPVGADELVFTLETAGVGAAGQCHGRFFVMGMFMQTQD